MIACVKLITGEDIIADIAEDVSGLVVLTTPLMIMMVPRSQDQFSIGLVPFMPFLNKNTIRIVANNIIVSEEPSAELRNEYNKVTGKGIIVPTTPSLKLV